jgi:hypothetical protein
MPFPMLRVTSDSVPASTPSPTLPSTPAPTPSIPFTPTPAPTSASLVIFNSTASYMTVATAVVAAAVAAAAAAAAAVHVAILQFVIRVARLSVVGFIIALLVVTTIYVDVSVIVISA